MLRSNSNYPPVVDYSNKNEPVLSTIGPFKHIEIRPLLTYPDGITVDYHTDNIYIGNQETRKVFVFDREVNLLFHFSVESAKTYNTILFSYLPTSISIHNLVVYLKLSLNNLFIFDLNGNYITEILTWNTRSGFAINQSNGDIYIYNSDQREINVLTSD